MNDRTLTKPAQLTVKAANAVHDGKGGFFQIGWKFAPVDAAAAKALKAKGFAA